MKPTLQYFWLLFAQIATVCLGVLFVVATLRPDLLARVAGRSNVVLVQEAIPNVQAARIERSEEHTSELQSHVKSRMPSSA